MYSHPYEAAESGIPKLEQLYQAHAREKIKQKKKLEESQTSLVKVCSLLHAATGHPFLSIWIFIDLVRSSLVHDSFVSPFSL